MGIFDALIGANTAKGTQAASAEGQNLFNLYNYYANKALGENTDKANAALNTGATGGLSALASGYGNAENAVSSYGDRAQSTLGSGIDRAASTALGGNAAYSPYVGSGQQASGALSDALGLNGPEGSARATAAFQAAPGYAFTKAQATDAATRAAAATGLGASGNTLDAVARLSARLADQGFQSYLSNLSGLGSQGLAAASGMSSNNNTAAGLFGTGATTGANLTQNTGQNLGTLGAALGTGSAAIDTGLGSALSSNYTGLGQGIANVGLNTAQGISNLAMTAGKAEDSATNANNGILSNLIKNVGGGFLSGGLTGGLKAFF